MLASLPGGHAVTCGADKGFDNRRFESECRNVRAKAHVARKKIGSAIPAPRAQQVGYQNQPAEAEADRGGLWMDEDGGATAQGAAPGEETGGVDVHLRSGRLQPGQNAEAADATRLNQPAGAPGGASTRLAAARQTVDPAGRLLEIGAWTLHGTTIPPAAPIFSSLLARISHQPPAAMRDQHAPAALRAVQRARRTVQVRLRALNGARLAGAASRAFRDGGGEKCGLESFCLLFARVDPGLGSSSGRGARRTKRSGWAPKAPSRTT